MSTFEEAFAEPWTNIGHTIASATDTYAQGIWDMLRALGHDTDGDPGPAATIAGMGPQGFVDMAVRTATEIRQEWETDVDRLLEQDERTLAENCKLADERDNARRIAVSFENELAEHKHGVEADVNG